MDERRAYVTVLSTDTYLPGVIGLFESLKRTKPQITTFAVVVNEDIKQETLERLEQEGYKIIKKSRITAPENIRKRNAIGPTSNWNNTFDKFNVFSLEEFDKIVYLDSDMYIRRNIDELFERPDMSAVIAGKSYLGHEFWRELNSGIMVIEPKIGVTEGLISKMEEMSKQRIKGVLACSKRWKARSKPSLQSVVMNLAQYIQSKGDQDVIEEYYNWQNNPSLELPEGYNMFASYTDYYINELGFSKDDLSVIHFVGRKKPWMLSKVEMEKYMQTCKRKNKINELQFFEEYLEIIQEKGKEDMNLESEDQKAPTFSIIIPMKNADKYIKDALDSIAEQGFTDLQVLVVDDNSDYTDISKYRVNEFKHLHPEINLELLSTTKEEGGPGGARNIGLDNATGEYILFLDADDILNPNALNSIKKSIDENPETDLFVLGMQLVRRDKHENDLSTLDVPSGKIQESRFFQVGANTAGNIWSMCPKRKLFGDKDDKNKIRFKPNCIFEDVPSKIELFVRNKKKIKAVPAMTHTQRSRRNTSIAGTLRLRDVVRLREAYIEIANIKTSEPDIGLRDKMYIDSRKVSFLACSAWLIQKAIRNKLDILKEKRAKEKQDFEDMLTLEGR